MDKNRYPNTAPQEIGSEVNWAELYSRLRTIARLLVYKHRIPRWCGQEEDVADDVTQETARRFIERQQKAARGNAPPIDIPEQMLAAIAHNYVLDLVRREHRVIPLSIEELTPIARHRDNHDRLIEEIAIENVNNELFFLQLVRVIVSFPTKRRTVLLMDLANRMYFDEEPTPLQTAFLTVGINLQAYQIPIPVTAAERSRYASLLCLAYASLAHLVHIQELDVHYCAQYHPVIGQMTRIGSFMPA